ncbi:hypothetical protein V6N12_050713 [Hibiscus sabdariffa]|uniref:Uncharacterized protein n=1 Tax=Hibiscus sabdariffa TaxID=183260 RepID=A0ABR2GDI6_9ROSI
MDVADAIPIQVAMPMPAYPSAASAAQGSYAAAPSPPPPADPQPSPAHSTEAPPLYILQLRSQIQWIEAQQIEFITESKPSSLPAPAPPVDIVESSGAWKRKAPAARVFWEDTPLDQPADPPAAADPLAQPSPAKRR